MISKESVLTGWNFMRWLRLGLGAFIAIQAIQTNDAFSGVIAVFLLYQAIANKGCCGSTGCEIPVKSTSSGTKDIEFEEIKST